MFDSLNYLASNGGVAIHQINGTFVCFFLFNGRVYSKYYESKDSYSWKDFIKFRESIKIENKN